MQYGYSHSPALTGYRIAYRMHENNHCPSCGQTHWVIGRSVAECAFCNTALPITAGGNSGPGLFRSHRGRREAPLAA